MATRTRQTLNGHVLAVSKTFEQKIISTFSVQEIDYVVQPQILVNVDTIAAFFEAKLSSGFIMPLQSLFQNALLEETPDFR